MDFAIVHNVNDAILNDFPGAVLAILNLIEGSGLKFAVQKDGCC